MTVSSSIEATARLLTELLPTIDSSLQWQAQLLSNYRGHVFVPHGVEMSTSTLWQAVVAQLSMQAEIADLKSQNRFLESEQKRLESEIKEVELQSRRQVREYSHGSVVSAGEATRKQLQTAGPPFNPTKALLISAQHSSGPPSSKASTPAIRSFFSTFPFSGSRSDRAPATLAGHRPHAPITTMVCHASPGRI